MISLVKLLKSLLGLILPHREIRIFVYCITKLTVLQSVVKTEVKQHIFIMALALDKQTVSFFNEKTAKIETLPALVIVFIS